MPRETPEEVSDLLGRCTVCSRGTARRPRHHAELLGQRLQALGAAPARRKGSVLSAGAKAWVKASGVGGTNHGSNARNAFVFEHFEIATFSLLRELAERAEDAETEQVAAECLAEDVEMAATINRNWANVLTLTLAG